jgi:hypothetical protein
MRRIVGLLLIVAGGSVCTLAQQQNNPLLEGLKAGQEAQRLRQQQEQFNAEQAQRNMEMQMRMGLARREMDLQHQQQDFAEAQAQAAKEMETVCAQMIGEPLDNEGVIRMVKAGGGADIVAWIIGLRPPNYALTANDELTLRAAGVPGSIISAMRERNGCRRESTIPSRSATPMAQAVPSATPTGITVRFASTPAGAEVEVDGIYWGSTPTADLKRLPAGAHTIVVKKVGYALWERKIELSAGDDRTINAELEATPVDKTKPRISGLN